MLDCLSAFLSDLILNLAVVQPPSSWNTHFLWSTAGIFPTLTGFSHLCRESPQLPYPVAWQSLAPLLYMVGSFKSWKEPSMQETKAHTDLLLSLLASSPSAHLSSYPINPFCPPPIVTWAVNQVTRIFF